MITLDKTRAFEQEHTITGDNIPEFHLIPRVGWMNDPNGFSTYQGEVHLFYQYYPYATEWGPMHWGHCKTKDFIKWEYLPVALAPEDECDLDGCFSGTAVEHEGKHLLVYTGVSEQKTDAETSVMVQNQCIAVGDGIEYRKMAENPVVDGKMLPAGCSNVDFRDPKIWKEDNTFYMAVANRNGEGNGQILLYQSDDLTDWKFASVLLAHNEKYGKMWKCPDFFPLNDKHVLIISPQEMVAQELEFHNGNNVIYVVGEYDKKTHVLTEESAYTVDYGLDFYAPQTVQTEDGRRILIGWMMSWETKIRVPGEWWIGMMTIPRELQLREDNRLIQNPVRELEQYRHKPVTYNNQAIKGRCELAGISGRVIDMTVELLEGDYDNFEISFACGGDYRVSCNYNKNTKILRYDRKYSGLRRDIICEREIKIYNEKENVKLRFLLDKYSAEIFINDGEQVFSALHITPLEADGIEFYCDGYVSVNIEKYEVSTCRFKISYKKN